MVPTRTGKPGKIRKLFPVREKSGNFEQTEGDFTQNTEKVRIIFIFIFADFLIEVYLLNNFFCIC